MSKYINDSMTNSDLEQSLSQSKVYPLVQECCFALLYARRSANRLQNPDCRTASSWDIRIQLGR